MRRFLRSKIHEATVTGSRTDYEGSITIDKKLMRKAGFRKGERVLVASIDSGARLETYIIPGEEDSGTIQMNGAAANLIGKDEKIIVMGFEIADKPTDPKKILVNEKNRFVKYL